MLLQDNLALPLLIKMIERPTSLVTDTTGTYLSRHFPEALLYASLLAAEPFLVGDERLATWGALYKAALESEKNETAGQMRSRYQAG